MQESHTNIVTATSNLNPERPVFFYIPEGFNVCEHLSPYLYKFADHALYLVHRIYGRRIFERRDPEAYVELKAAYLRNVLPWNRYKEIVTALISAGVIETDGRWVVGQKSKGFKLAAHLRDATFRRHEVLEKSLLRKLARLRQQQEQGISLDVHQHLYRFLKEMTLNPPTGQAHVQAQAIMDGHFFMHPDRYGRVHTNLTNLDSNLRQHLSYKGMQLVNLDIRNSQPLFLAILVMQYFMHNGNLSSQYAFKLTDESNALYYDFPVQFIKLQRANQKINNEVVNTEYMYSTNPPPHPPPLRCELVQHILPNLPRDVCEYICLCQDGKLYEYLMHEANVPIAQRQEWKHTAFGKLFFNKNYMKYKETKMFERLFPNVSQVVRELKRKDYRHLPRMLQRLESSLIINRVVRRMMVAHPDTFVATIHDSVITTVPAAETVLQIMREEFYGVGLQPTIRTEHLTPNLASAVA